LLAPRSAKRFASSKISKYISTEKKKKNKSNKLKFSMFNTKSEFIKVIDNSHIINKIYAKQKENKPPKSSVWY